MDLSTFSDPFSDLRQLTFVRSVEHFEELDSTNSYALRRLDGPPLELPAVIVADRQLAGRGRGARRWWSGDGALTFSLIVDDASAGFAVGSEPRIALLAGLAVADVLDGIVPPATVGLKWPNDVLLSGRKVCGILVEVSPRRRDAAVIGIGLNVNNSRRSAPPELRQSATALCDELHRELDSAAILLSICRETQRRFATFVRDAASVRESWGRRCVLTGRRITAGVGPLTVQGRCGGIQEDGSLIVETSGGRQSLRSADHVRPADDEG